eukprot:scaffold336417_cov20-Prasinocladus_malaysianus.AAC.1
MSGGLHCCLDGVNANSIAISLGQTESFQKRHVFHKTLPNSTLEFTTYAHDEPCARDSRYRTPCSHRLQNPTIAVAMYACVPTLTIVRVGVHVDTPRRTVFLTT